MAKNKKRRTVPQQAKENNGLSHRPVVGAEANYDKQHPIWSFSKFDRKNERWGEVALQRELNKVVTNILNFSNITWAEIKSIKHDNNKSSNHSVKRDGLEKEATRRLDWLKLNDVDEVFSLRLTNKIRLIGFLQGNIFELLWVDLNHEVCKSSKKHT